MLSETLPEGWTLYVKEHPHQFVLNDPELSMDFYMITANKYKNRKFYDKILSMDRTILLDSAIPSHNINKTAMAIATFNGTVAIEATVLRKPILLFGADTSWIKYCKDIISLRSFQDCQKALARIEGGWVPTYDDVNEVINQYGYPMTPEGSAAVVDKIVAYEHSC